jgi:O-antigen/teichoic acid export membrane protein
LGTRGVASLYNTQRLAGLGQTLLSAVGGAAWAGLAELHARGERETFNRRLVELSRLVAVLAAAGLAPVVAFNRPFVRLWLGADFPYGGDAVAAVAAYNVFVLAQLSLWTWCFGATGKVARVVPQAAVGAALNLAASVWLARRVGLVGPLLGTALAMTLVGLTALPGQLRAAFGTPVGPLLRAVAGPFLWAVASGAALYALGRRYEPQTWPGLALAMGLPAAGSLAFGVLVLLTPEDRDLWRRRLPGLRSRQPRGTVAAVAGGEKRPPA